MKKIRWGPTEDMARYHQGKFEEFLGKSPEEIKRLCLDENGRLKHLIRAEHFDLEFLETICETANAARRTAKLGDNFLRGLLDNKSVLNYFQQPSSRTFNSFSMAEAHLGMRREEVRDLQTSSTVKGESDRDSLRTLSSYFDAVVCRTESDIYDLFALWVMNTSQREIPIVNAGSGKNEHPTQAILDYYTWRESFDREIGNGSYAFVGDCLRGRTVHSGAKLLALHKGVTIYFVGPEEFQIDGETERYLLEKGVNVHKVTTSLDEVLPKIDKAVYMTRVQNEHGGEGRYDPRFTFKADMLDRMQEQAILMHPLPKREEIDPALDYSDDPRIMIWRQVRNGMWTRLAEFAYLFGVDGEIREHYKKIVKATAPKPR